MTIRLTPTGEMRHRVAIQARNDTNAKGSVTLGYTEGTAWWVRILPVRSDEMLVAERETGKTYSRMNGRFFDGLTTKHRLQSLEDTNQYWAIEGVKDLGWLHREHELICSEEA